MEVMDTLQKFIDESPKICTTIKSAANDVKKLVSYSSKLTEALTSSLEHIDSLEGDVAELKFQFLRCKTPLKKSYSAAELVVSRLQTALKYGDITDDNDYKEKILTSARKSTTEGCYYTYMAQLGVYFEQCGKFHAEFEQYYEEALIACGESTFEKKEAAAKGGKAMGVAGRVAMRVGAVAGVAGVAGLAAVAGLFTFGIGAPIVLGIAGAASGAGMAGGAVVRAGGRLTANAGDRYVELENRFSTLSKGFAMIVSTAESLETSVVKLVEVKKRLVYDKKGVEEVVTKGTSDNYRAFVRCFNMFVDTMHETRCKMDIYCASLKDVERDIKNIQE